MRYQVGHCIREVKAFNRNIPFGEPTVFSLGSLPFNESCSKIPGSAA